MVPGSIPGFAAERPCIKVDIVTQGHDTASQLFANEANCKKPFSLKPEAQVGRDGRIASLIAEIYTRHGHLHVVEQVVATQGEPPGRGLRSILREYAARPLY